MPQVERGLGIYKALMTSVMVFKKIYTRGLRYHHSRCMLILGQNFMEALQKHISRYDLTICHSKHCA